MENMAEYDRYIELRQAGESEYDARVKAKQEWQNDPQPIECPKCGAPSSEFKEGGGFAGETILWCGKCGQMLWENKEEIINNIL